MSYLVFARKYRPQTFGQVIQQTHVTQTLANAISSGRVAHAILFSGPRGTGKTTIARILAKAMNCEKGPVAEPCNECRSCKEITAGSAVDVFEIDGASNNGVEQVRELRENTKYMPAHSPFKIYIIDEVHMLSTAAFNALLKTLEEPPDHIIFLFATTEPRKIPVTILSRCQRHDLKRVESTAIKDHMVRICGKEGIDISQESLDLIAREAGGSVRDALSLLDQVATGIDGTRGHDSVLEILGVIDRKVIFDISDAMLRGDAATALDIIDDVYHHGYSITDFYASLVGHFRHLLIAKLSQNAHRLVDLPAHEIEQIQNQVKNLSVLHIQQILDILFKDERSVRWSAWPKMVLEVAVVKILQIKPALPIEDLIEKIDNLQRNLSGIQKNTVSNDKENDRQSTDLSSATKKSPDRLKSRPMDQAPKMPEKNASEIKHAAADFSGNPKDVWRRLLDIISEKHPSIAPNLMHSRLRKLTGDHLEIEVNGSLFNLNRMKKRDSVNTLKAVASDFFDRKMDVKIKAGKKNKNRNGRQDQDKANRLKRDLLDHPVVADAIEIFNGKLVDVDIS
jgi:DNA polymerase-3 subunit gamma/tau